MIRSSPRHSLCFSVVLMPLMLGGVEPRAEGEPGGTTARLMPLPNGPAQIELAPLMGELQRLTHKLSLSVAAGNRELARFYSYESIALLRDIQRQVPEYEGQPIALLIDRLAMPWVEALKAALESSSGIVESPEVKGALRGIVESCNECHRSTQHGFIRINTGTGVNPFNQDFAP